MARFIAFLIFVIVARGAIESPNDLPFADDTVLRTWEVTEGLHDNHISGIARGADGYLWITNFSGLFRFDGARFVHMDQGSMAGLPSPWVSPVFFARDHSLWLGLERGGIARWRSGKVDSIAPIRPRPTEELWPASFAEEDSGAVWFGAMQEARASRFASGKVVSLSAEDGIPPGIRTTVRVALDGQVWVATSGGCAVFDGNRFQVVDPDAGSADRLILAPSRVGGMWAIRGGKLLRYDGMGARLETIAPPWLQAIGQINALHEDATGTLWIGTRDFGLLRYRGGEFARVNSSFADISCLAEDGEGNLWVGTWGGGLNRLSARNFFLWQTRHGLLHDGVRSLCEDTDGRLWVLSRDGGLVRALEGEGHAFAPVHGLSGALRMNLLCADPKSGVWLGTSDGLMQWQGGVLRRTSLKDAVAALFMDRNQTLWIATESGALFRHHDGHQESVDGVSQVCALAQDSKGRLWVGTQQGGLYFRENGAFVPVALPGAGAEQAVRFIVSDGADTMWIGALLGGLYRWKNGVAVRVADASGVSLAEVRSLVIKRGGGEHPGGDRRTREGRPPESEQVSPQDIFWIGTATGLLRGIREDIEGFLDGDRATVNLVHCGSNEGLPNAEFAVGAQNAAVCTSDGRLYFGTNRGLLEIHADAGTTHPVAARVVIEAASAEAHTDSPEFAGVQEFPPRPDAIRIRYTLPELGTPERVRFRYRLGREFGGGQWIDVDHQREATIVRPEPGRYHFEVTAAVGDRPWLSRSANIEFTVRPAWWQTGTFRGGIALALAGAIVVIVRGMVMRRMRARIRELEQAHGIERERSRIARDMHDELGANLTHITAITRLASLEPDKGAKHLGEIEAAARQTVESLDEIVWAVNPRNDTLAGTVEYIGKYAAGFLGKTGIELEIALPDAFPPRHVSAELRHHLFLAVKESLNNVVKHSAATRAKLEVRITTTRLEVIVTDNGHGFEPGTTDRFSNGLVNMRDRMAGIGGSCHIESHPGAGCRVLFGLPWLPLPVETRHADSA